MITTFTFSSTIRGNMSVNLKAARRKLGEATSFDPKQTA
jgi:hypothetical protein